MFSINDFLFFIRHATELVLPFPSVNNIRMNFKYQIVNVWNSVPNNIKIIDNCSEFKGGFKTYLIFVFFFCHHVLFHCILPKRP